MILATSNSFQPQKEPFDPPTQSAVQSVAGDTDRCGQLKPFISCGRETRPNSRQNPATLDRCPVTSNDRRVRIWPALLEQPNQN